MPVVRQLTEAGIAGFKHYLNRLSAGAVEPVPSELLTGEHSSAPLGTLAEVEDRPFESKRDAAEYLVDRLAGLGRAEVDYNAGLWSWLSLFYFDQVCPAAADGRRHPKKEWLYIPSQHGWTYYRHLLACPFRLLRLYPNWARVFLHGPVHQHADITEQFASRMEIITNPGMVQVIDQLYYAADANAPKRGATTRTRPGNVRRLVDVFWQFHLTYDLYAMTADDILRLLPAEFNTWRGR
jgi:hypothetical protein